MLDKVRTIARIMAGLIAFGYLAWRDPPLAVAVVFLCQAVAWLTLKSG